MIWQLAVSGLGFKEIIWDQGYIWVLILVMTVGFIFEQLRYILKNAKEATTPAKERPKKGQPIVKIVPSYKIIFNKKIE